ncbi:putative dioxygenase [Dissulfuribacter thermophilus]|uniref:MEMO1 family protein DBT_0273 n=1 Tax=Dissulfuribacter thermophilus TaxID=1156395 RepID=A0A1B9F956_9BACT|nr:AmmeMemoRadiSam system protein B [Dissulfuribacter thermophilus]OCC16456.1 putative dioxygenase [Dissulfuribacter thermophilus]
MILRRPAVADQFYPGDPDRLHYEIGKLMGDQSGNEKAVAVISPHAGYMYSGHVAGAVFSKIRIPPTCIILGPNHTGFGAPISVMSEGIWQMPMGDVAIDSPLAKRILEYYPEAEEDVEAHLYEHSLEVQVPFLQYKQNDLKICPICLSRLSFEESRRLGEAISRAVSETDLDVLIVASTDMTHYESGDVANEKDRLAIERILSMDPEGLYNTVLLNQITMCGFIPTVVTLVAAMGLGATKARLIKYATSGDITGDYRQVVGYSSFIIQ